MDEWARQLAFRVTISVGKCRHQGVREHLHVIGIRLGDMVIYTNDMTTFSGDGLPIAHKMPHVARSWDEFVAKARAVQLEAAGAMC
jgi:hypothetical protein